MSLNESMSCLCDPSYSNQDFVITGHRDNPNGFKWMVVADGHGPDLVINEFKKINWDELLSSFSSAEDISKNINNILENMDTAGSGATLSIIKIYNDHFDCYSAGDSLIKIYKNGENFYENTPHNVDNEDELKRLKEASVKMCDDSRPCIVNSTTLTIKPGKYFHFNDPQDTINMTRSFGHNQLTKEFLQHECIDRNSENKYKIVMGSDGFWDLICSDDTKLLGSQSCNTNLLLELANKRWRQRWIVIPESEKGQKTFISEFPHHQIDDICVATWHD